MGSQQSKIDESKNTPREILQVSDNASEAEIRKQYKKMLLKYHIDYGTEKNAEKTQSVIKAFKTLKDNNFEPEKGNKHHKINFKKYTSKYFYGLLKMSPDLFYEEVDKIYLLIEQNEQIANPNIKLPKFGDCNKKMTLNSAFYVFFKGFKTSMDLEHLEDGTAFKDKEISKAQKTLYNEAVRTLTQCVLMVDPRLKVNVFELYLKPIKELKVKKPKLRIKKSADKYAFYCDACKKGFMSENTMLNHLKSNKHKERIQELGLEERSIDEIINERNLNLNKHEKEKENVEESSKALMENISSSEVESAILEDTILAEELVGSNTKKIDVELTDANTIKEGPVDKNMIKQITKKCANLTLKKSKKKTCVKKKVSYVSKENEQLLTCAYCHTNFPSRNKLFDHIRETHSS